MKAMSVLTIGMVLLGLRTVTLAREILAIDWNGSADIPDRGGHLESPIGRSQKKRQ